LRSCVPTQEARPPLWGGSGGGFGPPPSTHKIRKPLETVQDVSAATRLLNRVLYCALKCELASEGTFLLTQNKYLSGGDERNLQRLFTNAVFYTSGGGVAKGLKSL